MAQCYVPAWQRLGLKLKNQPTNGIHTSFLLDESTAAPAARKRKFDVEDEGIDHTQKTSKKKKRKPDITADLGVDSNNALTIARDVDVPSQSRRKSVTFSPDTKAEDGDSTKRIVQAAYASRLARATGLEETDIVAAESELNGASTIAKSKKNGVIKQAHPAHAATTNGTSSSDAQQHKKPTAQPSSKVEKAQRNKKRELALEYLREYQRDRASWKFNKSRQVAVLKMALDVERIPAEYDQALQLYLEGLQGETSRKNLQEQAGEILRKLNDEGMVRSSDDEAQLLRAKMIDNILSSAEEGSVIGGSDSRTRTDKTQPPISTISPRNNGNMKTTSDIANPDETTTNGVTHSESNGTSRRKRRSRPKKKRVTARWDADSSSSSSDDSESESNGED